MSLPTDSRREWSAVARVVDALPAFSDHDHHHPDAFFREPMTLDRLFYYSYVSWTGNWLTGIAIIGMKPTCCLSDLVREIKKSSNEFIKEHNLTKFKFNWQEGFGAFSYSHSQLDDVIGYIQRQKEHHRKKTFKEEYIELLKQYKIYYDEKYLFEWIEET